MSMQKRLRPANLAVLKAQSETNLRVLDNMFLVHYSALYQDDPENCRPSWENIENYTGWKPRTLRG